MSDALDQFFRRIHDEAIPYISAASVPLYVFHEDRVKLNRTGILLKIADSHFILTAAHDLHEIIKCEIPLLADYSRAHHIPIPLVEATFYYTEEKKGRDVAAIKLPNSVVEQFLPGRRFLTMAELDTESKPQDGLYVIFGFPTAFYQREENVQRTDPLIFLSSIYGGRINPDYFFDPAVYIALGFEQQCFNVLTSEDKQLPDISGISGCGFWRIAAKNEFIGWDAKKIRLVAIQHRWFKQSQYVVGTWINYALELIRDSYPSLREPMQLVFPMGY